MPGPAPLPGCPYPGMVPFDETDSDRFFGREQEIQELIEQLRLRSFLTVIGASGSGKSSLVRAGLIPALRKSRAFGPGQWLVRTLRPGEQPLATLAAAVAPAVAPRPAEPAPAPAEAGQAPLAGDNLLAMPLAPAQASGAAQPLTNGSAGLLATPAQAVEALLATKPDARRLLLLVD